MMGIIVKSTCPVCKGVGFVTNFSSKVCGVLGCTHVYTPDRADITQQLIDGLSKDRDEWKKTAISRIPKVKERQVCKFPNGNSICIEV